MGVCWEKTDSIVCTCLVERVALDRPHCFSENTEVGAQNEQLRSWINNMVLGRNRKPVWAPSDNSTLPLPHRTQPRSHYFLFLLHSAHDRHRQVHSATIVPLSHLFRTSITHCLDMRNHHHSQLLYHIVHYHSVLKLHSRASFSGSDVGHYRFVHEVNPSVGSDNLALAIKHKCII